MYIILDKTRFFKISISILISVLLTMIKGIADNIMISNRMIFLQLN